MKLPPGFRFHPTDVELIMYYLKRKIMGKKLLFEAISELNIYKFSPWDLPDKCFYKSKDLEWYFFVPRERKYASGARMNRASETGYWKVTGKDRPIRYDDKTVGSVKTLVFHQGTAPRGKRTDWVIHEYIFDEKDLADAGVPLGSYVLCKVFQKSGPGPKNGAQYGAPFKEEDWEDDEVPAEHNPSSLPSLPVFPENQSCSMVTCMADPGSASRGPFNELHPSSSNLPSVCAMPAALNSSDITPLPALPENLSCSVDTTMADRENESMWPLTESGPSFAKLGSQEMPPDEEDDIFHLFDNFTEDPAIFPAGDENNLCLNNLNQGRNVEDAPFIDGYDIYNGLGNLDNYAELDQTTFGVSVTQGADYSHNSLFLQDAPYLELNDLEIPLSHTAETIETAGLMMGNFCAPHDSDVDMRQLCFGGNSSASSQQVSGQNQLPALPEHYIQEVNYNVTNTNQGYNAAYTSDFSSYKQPEDSSYACQNQERGEQQRKFFSSMHAHCASNSLCLGFSIHVKAEVILWVDGCTNDALSAVFGDFSSILTCQSAVDNPHKRVCGYFYDITTAFYFGISLVFIFVSSLRFVVQFLLGVDLSSSTVLLRKLQINASVWSSLCWFLKCDLAYKLYFEFRVGKSTFCMLSEVVRYSFISFLICAKAQLPALMAISFLFFIFPDQLSYKVFRVIMQVMKSYNDV